MMDNITPNLLLNLLAKPLTRRITLLTASLITLSLVAICNSAYLYTNKGFANANQIIALQLITLILLTFLSIMLAINLYRRIHKPVVQLQQLAHAAANNEQDLPFNHHYQDAFLQIAQAFKRQQHQPNYQNQLKNQPTTFDEQHKTLSRQLKLADLTINCNELMFSDTPKLKSLEIIVAQLASLLTIEDIELCLMNAQKQGAEVHISAIKNSPLSADCISSNCSKCISDKPFCARLPGKNQQKIPLMNNQNVQIAVLIINLPLQSTDMLPWQLHCANSIASQLGKVLSINDFVF